MIALTPEMLLWAGFDFVLPFLSAAFVVWLIRTSRMDEAWATINGTLAVSLQNLATMALFFLGWTGIWNVLAITGFLFLGIGTFWVIATIKRVKPWYQWLFELAIITSFFSEVTVLAVYVFVRLHG